MCCRDGRAANRHARNGRVNRAGRSGGDSFKHRRSASAELPTSSAELIIQLLIIQAEKPAEGSPSNRPDAAA